MHARSLAPLFTLALVACGSPPPATTPSPPLAASTAPTPRAASTPSTTASPAEPASLYDKPPPNVLEVLHAPSPPQPIVSPTGETILLVAWVDYPPMSQVAEPFLKLAGVRVEPRTRRRHDTPGGYGVTACA